MDLTLKKIAALSLSFLLLVSLGTKAQSNLSGAWKSKNGDKTTILLIQDGYFTESTFSSTEYIESSGGPFTLENNTLTIDVEFNSANSDEVRTTLRGKVTVKGNTLQLALNDESVTYQRVDNGKAPLAGVWHITDRMQDGKVVPIMRTGTRKTLKVLTGNRFQWFAIDPGTKQFLGTGGGTYSFENGKYTENIEFFSRDNSRVGAKLTFDGSIKDGKWHHSGLSSKGDKIYEVWSRAK